jgi:hypothetical protein
MKRRNKARREAILSTSAEDFKHAAVSGFASMILAMLLLCQKYFKIGEKSDEPLRQEKVEQDGRACLVDRSELSCAEFE